MSKHTPIVYVLGVFAVFILIWYTGSAIGAVDRLVGLVWSLPGLLVGTFGILWSEMRKLERKIVSLQTEIETLKEAQLR